MAEFSGQTNDSLSLLKVLTQSVQRVPSSQKQSLQHKIRLTSRGRSILGPIFCIHVYAYIYCPHVVMSLNGRLLHFADECTMEECIMIARCLFQSWLPRLVAAAAAAGRHKRSTSTIQKSGMSSFGQDRQSCMHACTPEMYARVFVIVLVQKMLFSSHSNLINVDCTCRRWGSRVASGK